MDDDEDHIGKFGFAFVVAVIVGVLAFSLGMCYHPMYERYQQIERSKYIDSNYDDY